MGLVSSFIAVQSPISWSQMGDGDHLAMVGLVNIFMSRQIPWLLSQS
jgi:hypothetical protein